MVVTLLTRQAGSGRQLATRRFSNAAARTAAPVARRAPEPTVVEAEVQATREDANKPREPVQAAFQSGQEDSQHLTKGGSSSSGSRPSLAAVAADGGANGARAKKEGVSNRKSPAPPKEPKKEGCGGGPTDVGTGSGPKKPEDGGPKKLDAGRKKPEGSKKEPMSAQAKFGISSALNVAALGGLAYLSKEHYTNLNEKDRIASLHAAADAEAKQLLADQKQLQATHDKLQSNHATTSKELQAHKATQQQLKKQQEEMKQHLAELQQTLAQLMPPPEDIELLTDAEKAAKRSHEKKVEKARHLVEDLVVEVGKNPRMLPSLELQLEKYVGLQQGVATVEHTQFVNKARTAIGKALSELVALKNLDEAVRSKQKDKCTRAMAECESRGVNPGPMGYMANLVLQPEKLLDELVMKRKKDIDPFQTFAIEDFINVEKDAIEFLTPDELRERTLDRTRQLAENRRYFGARLADELQSFTERFDSVCSERIQKCLELQEDNMDREMEIMKLTVAEKAKNMYDVELIRMMNIQEKLAASTLEQEKGALTDQHEKEKNAMLLEHTKKLAALTTDVNAIAKVLDEDANELRRMRNHRKLQNMIENAVIAFEQKRAPMHEILKPLLNQDMDPVLQEIAKAGITATANPNDPSGGTILRTDAEIMRTFDTQLRKWAIACFVEKPQSVMSHIYANVIGRFFIIHRGEKSGVDNDNSTQTDAALHCLNRAAHYVDNGDINRAIWAMDEIPAKHHVRAKVEPWITETRAALCGETTLKALKARMQVLNGVSRTNDKGIK